MNRILALVVLGVSIGCLLMWLLSQGGLPKRSIAVAGGVIGGPFAIACAVFNWDWFFEDHAARRLSKVLAGPERESFM
jgi:hypothetical protein